MLKHVGEKYHIELPSRSRIRNRLSRSFEHFANSAGQSSRRWIGLNSNCIIAGSA